MSETRGRVFGGLAALAVLWIVVYWWWEPRRPAISFDQTPASAEGSGSLVPVLDPMVEARRSSAAPGAHSGGSTGAANQVIEPRPVPAVIPPQFRDYTVRDGDTWESIARRELGSAGFSDALLRSNPLMSGERPRAGRVIRIPLDPQNIQGKPNPEIEPPAAPAKEATLEYTVKPGDTLSKIAKAHYGSVSFAEFIFQANRDRLRSPDELKLGDKLRLPPRP